MSNVKFYSFAFTFMDSEMRLDYGFKSTIEIEKILRFWEAARWAPSFSVSMINCGGL